MCAADATCGSPLTFNRYVMLLPPLSVTENVPVAVVVTAVGFSAAPVRFAENWFESSSSSSHATNPSTPTTANNINTLRRIPLPPLKGSQLIDNNCTEHEGMRDAEVSKCAAIIESACVELTPIQRAGIPLTIVRRARMIVCHRRLAIYPRHFCPRSNTHSIRKKCEVPYGNDHLIWSNCGERNTTLTAHINWPCRIAL